MNHELVMMLFRIGIIVIPSAACAFALGYMKGYSKGVKTTTQQYLDDIQMSAMQYETAITMPEQNTVKLTTRKRRAKNELA